MFGKKVSKAVEQSPVKEIKIEGIIERKFEMLKDVECAIQTQLRMAGRLAEEAWKEVFKLHPELEGNTTAMYIGDKKVIEYIEQEKD